MGDGLKLSKDKRHRSSSSLSGVLIEGTRSERKLDIRASIPEADDQFAIAEARCDDLQEKIDLVKGLKKKRKLKKRSMTRVVEQPITTENVPFITVRTQPKKKVSQQAARLRRLEIPPNPTRGYLDPATVEQHHMIGQVRGYNYRQTPIQEQIKERQVNADLKSPGRPRHRRAHADGDSLCGRNAQASCDNIPLEVACGDDEMVPDFSDTDVFDQQQVFSMASNKKPIEVRYQVKQPAVTRRRHVPREVPHRDASKWPTDPRDEVQEGWRVGSTPVYRRRRQPTKNQTNIAGSASAAPNQVEERPVVELFNKSRGSGSPEIRPWQKNRQNSASPDRKSKKAHDAQIFDDQTTGPMEDATSAEFKKEKFNGSTPPLKEHRHPRRVKYRSRRYELPTVASQMKQAGVRYYYGTANQTNIPFVVSKSTAPSHNIGVNIQQVLNGLKIQQPLSGIPLTIAHHMGLGHIPTYGTKSATAQPTLDNREINAIRLGRRLLRLPSYKYISYNRLLNLYREGDGMVPRFLRAISRPHYFYTSMYNLATNREDFDGATSKGRGASQEAKQSLAEYASLYREYEQIDKCLKEGNYEPEWERRRDELSRELAAREDHIRRVVQEYRTTADVDQSNLRASASTAEESYRHSTFKLNLGEQQQ